MRDDCSNCKKWEEKIYWTHFQSVQFSQILSGQYEQQLAIPEKFVKNLGDKLGKEVFLKVPSGAIWNVGLTSSEDALFLKLGWKEFVEDNSLEENDILIFKYSGNLQFDVLLFDRQNLCEKEASYFVRKCENTEMSCGRRRKESLGKISRENQPPSSYVPGQEGSSDVKSDSSDDVTEWTPSKRPKKDAAVVLNSVAQGTRGNRKTRGRKRSSTSGIHAQHAQCQQLSSNRRPVTEEEKENAIQMANAAASSDDSLVLVLQSYSVYRGFYLTLPAWWARDRIPPKNIDIILQVKGKSWNVKFFTRGGGGMLTSGWKNFALDNLLEEFDVCLFNIAAADGRSSGIVMDVKIFRVVEEAIPLTPRPRGRKLRKQHSKQDDESTMGIDA